MSRDIHCTNCNNKVGELANGSKIKKDIGYLCGKCLSSYKKHKLGDKFRDVSDSGKKNDIFGDLFKNNDFGDLFKGK